MINLAINGFGRIGRAAFKIALDKSELSVAAINDLTDTKTLAHLLQYDTVYGRYEKEVGSTQNSIVVGGKEYRVFAEKDPGKLPWGDLEVDVVLECTGVFTDGEKARAHVHAGAKKVIISAPAKDEQTPTLLLGVSDVDAAHNDVVCNASCTTNSIAPVADVLHKNFGIKKALMTTIHSYTADQNLVDGPHKDLRRARAAAQNIVPTSTGAAVAVTKVIPELNGNFGGLAVRVPTAVVSLSDFTLLMNQKVTEKEINDAFIQAAEDPQYKGILAVTDKPLVSSDFIGNSYSSIVDLSLTKVVGGDLVKVVAWYDNEWGYANRLVELAVRLGANASKEVASTS